MYVVALALLSQCKSLRTVYFIYWFSPSILPNYLLSFVGYMADFSKSEFTIELKAILEKAKVPQKFVDYLVTNAMEEVTDLALMSPDDAHISEILLSGSTRRASMMR